MEKEYYDEDEIDLVEVAKTLWRGKVLIAVVTLVSLLIAGGYIILAKPVYQSTASLEFMDIGSNVGAIPYIMNTNKEELEHIPFEEGVTSVAVTNTKQTTMLEIAVKANDPVIAKEACAKLLDTFKEKEKEKLNRELMLAKETAENAKQQAIARAQTMTANSNWQSAEENIYITTMRNCYDLERKLVLFDDKVLAVKSAPSYSEAQVAPDRIKVLGIALSVGLILGCAIVLLRNFVQNLSKNQC